jgi:hypothetical protein
LGDALAANEDKIQEAVVAEVVNAFRKQAAIDEIIKKRPPGGFAYLNQISFHVPFVVSRPREFLPP